MPSTPFSAATFPVVARLFGGTAWALWMAAVAAADPTGLTDGRILDDTRVIEISISLPAADWEALRNESRDAGKVFRGDTTSPFTWRRADIVIDGVPIGSVGIRKKGLFGSLDSATPSLLVDFNRFVDQDPVDGLGRLTLNNNKQDRSLVSQSIAYRVFRAAGLAAPRVGFAAVTVNDEPLGIYSNVESIRKPFLRRSFGDGSGMLVEGTINDIVPESLDRLEVQGANQPIDRARLEELATLLASPDPLDLDKLGGLVDLDDFFTFWAVEALLNVWDGYTANQNNYFAYASPTDGLFRFIPWGADATLGQAPGFGGPFAGRRTPPPVAAQAALPNRLYFTPGMADRYRNRLEALLASVWQEEELLAEVDRLERLLSPVLGPRQASAPEAMESVRDSIRRRRGELTTDFETWPAAAPATWRRPMTSAPLGTATGSFAATYREGAVDDVAAPELDLALVLGGESVVLQDAEASVSTFMFPGFGGGGARREPSPPAATGDAPPAPAGPADESLISVVISGKRADDGKPIALNLFLDRRLVRDSADPVSVNGMVTEGISGIGIPGLTPMRTISGTFTPVERGLTPGERLGGTFALEITQTRGGLMTQAPMKKPEGAGARPADTEPPAP
ncbi:MAG: CotH kinase family protein [Planctomycetia bacterium]